MKSYFKGTKLKKTYSFHPHYGFGFYEYKTAVGYFDYYEADLGIPPLQTDDNFFINEKDEAVSIQKAMRSVRDDKEVMVYIINKEEIIEDEESYQQALSSREAYYKQREEAQKEKEIKELEKKITWWDRFRAKWL